MIQIGSETISRVRKIPSCQFYDMCKREGAEFHHTSIRRGYTSIAEYHNGVNCIADYNGRYGKGYVRFTPHYLPSGAISTVYCDYDYYIKEGA